jgi:hypothetical protein
MVVVESEAVVEEEEEEMKLDILMRASCFRMSEATAQ